MSQLSLIRATGIFQHIGASDVVLETHGTGTALGDPIEIGAVIGALCRNPRSPLVHCTAIKSNFGHLEAAAAAGGVTSLISLPLT